MNVSSARVSARLEAPSRHRPSPRPGSPGASGALGSTGSSGSPEPPSSHGSRIVHARPTRGAITRARLAIGATVLAWLAFLTHTAVTHLPGAAPSPATAAVLLGATLAVTALLFSAVSYLVARYGALLRLRAHERVPRAELDEHFARHGGGMTVLIPSYAEETRVVRATLWSAALQEFPGLRVALLLDDNPNPTDPVAAARLNATRRLASEVTAALREPAARHRRALEAARAATTPPTPAELVALAVEYDHAVAWLEGMAASEQPGDHADAFFTDQVLLGLAADLERTAWAVRSAIGTPHAPDRRRLTQLHARLVRIFEVEVTVFERKRYASLSHEANKAMNLNAYISLMGGSWVEDRTAAGLVLRPAPADAPADLTVPATEYLLTLDADSLLLREYCLRLVHLMEQPGNERVAIAQTPYSSFPGAPTRLERIAGATTDLQHLQHQGKTHFGATYWVGANAVIRRRALEDIAEVRTERGFPIRTYIQDRTVIEDTESTIDLGAKAWTLVNHPERLSYSATPPDFGSLVVQRRRWANGGLVILPKLLRTARVRRRWAEPMRPGEFWLRLDYLGSIAWSSAALVFLLLLRDAAALLSPLVFLGSVPYFVAMGADLKRAGHRRRDVAWVYAFNLILLPVNLAGVLKSLQQAVTGQKIPFARTPKVQDRTAAPALHALLPWVIVAVFVAAAAEHAEQQTWGGFAFAVVSGMLALAGALAFVGVRHTAVDAWLGITQLVRGLRGRATRRPTTAGGGAAVEPAEAAARLLYYGELHPAVSSVTRWGDDSSHQSGEVAEFRENARAERSLCPTTHGVSPKCGVFPNPR